MNHVSATMRNLASLPAALLAASLAAAPALAEDHHGDRVPHQFVIQISGNKTIDRYLDKLEATLLASYPEHQLYLIQTSASLDDDEVEMELDDDDNLGAAGHNELNGSVEGGTQTFFVRTAATSYATQPVVSLLGLPRARTLSTGAGVRVAILDTGVAPHGWYSQHLLPGYNFVSMNADVSDVGNGLDDNQNGAIDEQTGHGTFVAGLISLVAPGSQLLPVKVLDSDGFGNSYTVAAGIYYAVDHGASIINLSLSTPVESAVTSAAIAYASANGCTVVAAVGNEASSLPRFPAATAGVLAVGGSDLSDHGAPFTNHGGYLSLCGPGTSIVSTLPDGGFALASGTSFSAAIVSGTAALVRARLPQLPEPALESRLRDTCAHIWLADAADQRLLGRGRINPVSAILGLRSPPSGLIPIH